jgi:hypothetical protein
MHIVQRLINADVDIHRPLVCGKNQGVTLLFITSHKGHLLTVMLE